MPHLTSRVVTPKASRYLAQLCKHFAHKVEATWDEAGGDVDFGFGRLRLAAADDALTMDARADTAEGLARVEWVVTDHLARFAWREKPVIQWTPGAEPAGTD
ncbi:DUF2218 domain-containing protein [Acuticoccus sp. I52.16.1]|uniref:DUF2218 domain-containing protein n=1 Tax=Acuticoccus sp. I52.16.1 TaxID=2928472 RepID=UPI001FCFA538|nr:DUF2218 domain-containing protein [Acuticoccus sp. I52.16.1]UOM35632.1 DUF2218 domain-containing protein [Acuticoccus sp. I52.16.1]